MSDDQDPPSDLVPADVAVAVARINAEFYRQSPHDYLVHRVQAVTMMCGRPDLVSGALADGISVSGMTLGSEAYAQDPASHVDFLTMESEVLLFQAAEVLLRLVLAHAPMDGSSPALNMAAMTSHRAFYAEIERVFVEGDDDALDQLIIDTIHGVDSIEGLQLEARAGKAHGTPSQEGLVEGRGNVRDLLRYLARYVLSDDCRDIYNSAKHGLATRTGHIGFRIGGDDGRPPLTDQSGEALMCAAVGRKGPDGLRPVDHVFLWSNPAQALGIVQMSLLVLEAVWQLGKVRHTREAPAGGFTFRTFEGLSVEKILRAAYDLGPSRGTGPQFATIPHFRLPTGIGV